jgi:phage terminase small subunit
MRGRKPKPLALKILDGHQKSLTNFNEPKFPKGDITPPSWLRGLALEHWNELAQILKDAGLLTVADRPALAQLCDEYALSRRAKGAQLDKAKDRYRRMLVEFGLTPSSRSRIRSSIAQAKDKLQTFLEKKKA